MKPEQQQRIALVAEMASEVIGLSPSGAWMWMGQPGVWHCCYPDNDPTCDLNAMHAVLMTLDDWDQGAVFDSHLFKILIRRYGDAGVSTFAKVRAEAHELAEAFLLTKGFQP